MGQQEYDQNAPLLPDVLAAMKSADIRVWGWHEPRCPTLAAAETEAQVVAEIAEKHGLAGILMDAEVAAGGTFFQGGPEEAGLYASSLQILLHAQDRPLALCSHDIPQNFPNFPFAAFAEFSDVNVPQVYYGGSPSVNHRLDRAIKANSGVARPFVPVGAGWVGPADEAVLFDQLHENNCPLRARGIAHATSGYSFWHWAGAPMKLWNVLMNQRLT